MSFYPCLHLAFSEVLHLLLLHLIICSQGNPSKVFTAAIHLGQESCWQIPDVGAGGKRQRNQEIVKRTMKPKGVKMVKNSEEIRNPGSWRWTLGQGAGRNRAKLVKLDNSEILQNTTSSWHGDKVGLTSQHLIPVLAKWLSAVQSSWWIEQCLPHSGKNLGLILNSSQNTVIRYAPLTCSYIMMM